METATGLQKAAIREPAGIITAISGRFTEAAAVEQVEAILIQAAPAETAEEALHPTVLVEWRERLSE
jgi:hypothetical protein